MKYCNFFLSVTCLLLFSFSYAQRASNEGYKHDVLLYPYLNITNAHSFGIKIHSGSLAFTDDDLKGNKTRKKIAELNKDIEYFSSGIFELTNDNPDILVEIALDTLEVIKKEEKQHNIPCAREGAKLNSIENIKKNVKECPAFYYSVTYNLPYILKITDASGRILHIEKYSSNSSTTFGYDSTGLSGFLQKIALEDAFEKSGKRKIEIDALRQKIAENCKNIYNLLFFITVQDKFKIGTGKGKDFDYSKLNDAQTKIIESLNTGDNLEKELHDAIAIWKSEIETADVGNSDARINRKVATVIYGNLALAHMYLNQFKEARHYGKEYRRLANKAMNQAIPERANAIWNTIKDREERFMANKTHVFEESVPAVDLSRVLSARKSDNARTFMSSSDEFENFTSDFNAHKLDEIPVIESEVGDEVLESSPYSNRITYTAMQGNTLFMNSWYDGDLKGTSLPVKICELTELNDLRANGLELKSVPEEIGNLRNLTKLILANNSLTEIPSTIGDITKLEVLDLSGNELTELPAEISNLKSLKKLKLKGNKFSNAELEKIKAMVGKKCKVK